MLDARELNKLINAPTIESLWDLFQAKMAEYNFDRLIYGFTRNRTAQSLGNPQDFVLLTNHDTSYTDVFLGQGLYKHGPMMRWVLEKDGAFSWSVLRKTIANNTMTEEEKRVLEFNIKHGVVAGYSISFSSLSTRLKGAIALTAKAGMSQDDVDAMWKIHGEDIHFLCNLTHLRILSLPYKSADRVLTERQREVLSWVGDGKTIQDIAVLLNLTPVTVEKHLRLARGALGVETTSQAVLKAAFLNQIFVMDG